ncbi:MAG: hypothetical protein CL917_02590 [Deltaproteobacteria bacterium]|nr:hypothetical protein [Deltaproteobacteria bacterium]
MNRSRRDFLRKAGLGLVGASAGLSLPGLGRAIEYPFQRDFPISPDDLQRPTIDHFNGFCPNGKRVLEIVLYGGLSPWETFWVGSGGGDMFLNHQTGLPRNVDMRGAGDLVKNFDWCEGGPAANRVKYFGEDDAGQEIYWGPATQPLWGEDIFNSARMITFGHDKNVHELAMPLALTGLPIGNLRAAGLGAAISRAFRDNSNCENDHRPYSYVLMPDDIGQFRNISASISATGFHGGANRPVELTVGQNGLDDLFLNAEPTPEVREALEVLRDQYRQRLRWQGTPGDHVRSPQFDDYRSAALTLENSSALHDLVGGDTLIASAGSSCEESPVDTNWNRTARSLDVASILLDPNQGNARYVGMFDAGFPAYKFGGAPYDTHSSASFSEKHIPATMTNLYNCLSHLRLLIDQGDINLSDTMVVITTEMGRHPNLGASQKGREHWAAGTVQILLGCDGPRDIVGAIPSSGATSGYAEAPADPGATRPFQAAHARAAILKAAGIDPVSHDHFSLGDLLDPLYAATDAEMSNQIASRILGV